MREKTNKKLDELVQNGEVERERIVRSGRYSITKGHNLERSLTLFFKNELGYEHAKTSRNFSRVLDACSIDICNIPFLIQAKCGYQKVRPKADELFLKMKALLIDNFPSGDPIHKYPKILIHKMDERKPENALVTMTLKDFKDLLKNSKYNLKQK